MIILSPESQTYRFVRESTETPTKPRNPAAYVVIRTFSVLDGKLLGRRVGVLEGIKDRGCKVEGPEVGADQ